MTRLNSWNEAFDFALAQGLDVADALTYADGLFDCPGCGEAECGATCTPMFDFVAAAVGGQRGVA